MNEAPQVAEFYKKEVAGNPKIDMVFYSHDKNAEGLQKWLSTHRPPYPALSIDATKNRHKRLPLVGKHYAKAMPYYVVIDREGKEVVKGATTWVPVSEFIKENAAK